jgi:multicomponent Na+:H+ antiporter subunit A
VNPTFVLLLVSFLAAPVTAVAGWRRVSIAAPVAMLMTALSFGVALWGWAEGGDQIDFDWAPTWGLRLTFQLDSLAVLYSLLATGIGLAVVVYASGYLPLHLHHEHRPPADGVRFYAHILLFMGSMVGLVAAQDMLLIFFFWDVTAIASYYLIGYDHRHRESRAAALMALLVTGISAVCFLIGALALDNKYQTFALPELLAQAEPGRLLTIASILMAVAALAKSAQAPVHFWLPRAMAAPTPVSAYLHSAAMVAAGVFLLSRLYPLISKSHEVLDGLVVVGFLSMAVGGVLALTRDPLKQILAYSTISQYGYVVVMLGLGGDHGVAGACLYVIAHALAKSALFLTAGAVTEATGEPTLSGVGGLWRQMPLLAAGSGAAAAGLAALPLTIGFFKDDLFFATAHEHGGLVELLAVIGAALSFTYIGRFWFGIFLGSPRATANAIPGVLVAPVAALGALVVLGGFWLQPFLRLAEDAAAVTAGHEIDLHLGYHFDGRAENVMALSAWTLGVGLLAGRRFWWRTAITLARWTDVVGPERIFVLGLVALNAVSDRIHSFEVRDLRSRIATILFPAGLLVALGTLVTPFEGAFNAGTVHGSDLPTLLMIAIASATAIAAAIPRDHLSVSLLLSGVGFSLAVVYAFLGAPNVALVAVLIETVFTLVFLGMLTIMPDEIERRGAERQRDLLHAHPSRRWRDPLVAIISGGLAFVVVWAALSKPSSLESVITEQTRLTPDAHGEDVVTVILADFRGLDTMGEATVLGIALLGIATLLRRWRVR